MCRPLTGFTWSQELTKQTTSAWYQIMTGTRFYPNLNANPVCIIELYSGLEDRVMGLCKYMYI